MGEYLQHARFGHIKIGTCESLYYTSLLQFIDNLPELDSSAREYLKANEFRFRFPFPDEDKREIGSAEDFDRGHMIIVPASLGIELNHGDMFIRLERGSNGKIPNVLHKGIQFPCPADKSKTPTLTIMHWQSESYTGLEIVAQKIVKDKHTDGKIQVQTVVRCPYCDAMCRLSEQEALAIQTHYNELTTTTEMEKELLSRMVNGYRDEVDISMQHYA